MKKQAVIKIIYKWLDFCSQHIFFFISNLSNEGGFRSMWWIEAKLLFYPLPALRALFVNSESTQFLDKLRSPRQAQLSHYAQGRWYSFK